MDRVILTQSDLDYIENFTVNLGAEYPSLPLPVPIRDVEVVMSGDVVSARFIRNDLDITIYAKWEGQKFVRYKGHIEEGRFVRITDYKCYLPQKQKEETLRQLAGSLVSLYGDVMYFMVYGGTAKETTPAEPKTVKVHEARKKDEKKAKKSEGITYILRSDAKGGCFVPKGSHASPSYAFNVRGHFRHYKNGNTVWIAEYEKGGKSHKGKTYKVRREMPGGEGDVTA